MGQHEIDHAFLSRPQAVQVFVGIGHFAVHPDIQFTGIGGTVPEFKFATLITQREVDILKFIPYNSIALMVIGEGNLLRRKAIEDFAGVFDLQDQTASAVGGLVTIDFADKAHPDIRPVNVDFSAYGHALCIIDSRADHADLTDEYAAVTLELKAICRHFGREVTNEIPEDAFYAAIPVLREKCGDRAVMRAIHEYNENRRVVKQVAALESGDFDTFLRLTKESGYSSWMYLQNVIPAGYVKQQAMAVALGLCEHYLAGRGAYRVHGGGFAGTVQAFVPHDILDDFVAGIDAALGEGACHVLSIRPQGGVPAVPADNA